MEKWIVPKDYLKGKGVGNFADTMRVQTGLSKLQGGDECRGLCVI